MGKVKILAIIYDGFIDNITPMFTSGDLVTGQVIMELTDKIKVKSLKIHVSGLAEVHWTISRDDGDDVFHEEVQYLNHKELLIGRGVKVFTIIYDGLIDDIAPKFIGGDLVSGRIIMELTDEIKVESLKIHAKGKAKVHWKETNNQNVNSDDTTLEEYHQEMQYLKYKEILIGRGVGDYTEDVTTIRPGRHEFCFRFMLPETPLPATYKGLYGNVEYSVKAKLKRPWKLSIKVEEHFQVFERIDINNPLLLLPLEAANDKTLCCWCCASGVISLNVKIGRKGYVQGEEIQIFAEFENGASRAIVPKAVIHQTQTYTAQGHVKKIQETIAKLDGEPVPPGQTGKWNGKGMLIPTLPPSFLSCSIITMEYSLKVYLSIPSAINLTVDLPLVIGTIPLATTYYGGEQPGWR